MSSFREQYLSYDAITATVHGWAERHPSFVRLTSLTRTPEGRELWARDGLPAARADGGSVVAFTVPAAVLAPGQYVVILGPAGARGESDAEFVFEVRRSR